LKKIGIYIRDYLPILGIFIFIILYIYSTSLYPGGSRFDLNSQKFDWINNYWCTLFDSHALNGKINPARPFAILSMLVLWTSLLLFFYKLSEILVKQDTWKKIIKISATVSLLIASLLFTKFHDFVTTFSSIVGLLTLTGVVIHVAKSNFTFFKITGIVCMLLFIMNNFIYYSEIWIVHLPLLQKITFSFVLSWIIGLNIKMIQMK
jgi:hypothetical protein